MDDYSFGGNSSMYIDDGTPLPRPCPNTPLKEAPNLNADHSAAGKPSFNAKQFSSLQRDFHALEVQHSRLQRELLTNEDMTKSYVSKIANLEQVIAAHNRDKSKAENGSFKKPLEITREKLKDESLAHQRDNERFKQEIAAKDQQIAALTAKTEEVEQGAWRVVGEWKEEAGMFEARAKTAEAEVAQLREVDKRNQKLTSRLSDVESQLLRVQSELREATASSTQWESAAHSKSRTIATRESEITTLQQRITGLESELFAATEKAAVLEPTAQAYGAEKESLSAQMVSLEKQCAELRNQVSKFTRESREWEQRATVAEANLDELRASMSQQKTGSTQMRNELRDMNETNQMLKQEAFDRQNEVAILKEEINETNAENTKLLKEKSDFERSCRALQQEVAELRSKVDTQTQNNTRHTELALLTDSYLKQIEELKAEKVQLCAARDEATSRAAATAASCVDLSNRLANLQAESDAVKSTELESRTTSREKLVLLEAQKSELLNHLETIQLEKAKLLDKIANLGSDLERLSTVETKFAEETKLVADLRTQVNVLASSADAKEKLHEQELTEKQRNLTHTSNLLSELHVKYNAMEKLKSDAEDMKTKLEQSLHNTQSQLDAANAASAAEREKMSQLSEDFEALKKQLDSERRTGAAVSEGMTSSLAEARGELEATIDKLATVTGECEALKAALNVQRVDFKDMENKVAGLEATLRDREAAITRLSKELEEANANTEQTRATVSARINSLRTQVRQKDDDLGDALSELSLVRKAAKQYDEHATNLERVVRDLQEDAEGFKKKVAQLEEQKEFAEKQRDSSQSELQNLHKMLETMEDQFRESQADGQAAWKQLNAEKDLRTTAQQQFTSANEEVVVLRDRCAAANLSFEKALAEVQHLEQALERTRADLSARNESVDELQQQLRAQEAQCSDLQAQRDAKRDEQSASEEQTAQLMMQLHELTTKNTDLLERNEYAEAEMKELVEACDAQTMEFNATEERLLKDVATIRAEAETVKAELQRLAAMNPDKLQVDNAALRNELKNVGSENALLQQRLREAQDEMALVQQKKHELQKIHGINVSRLETLERTEQALRDELSTALKHRKEDNNAVEELEAKLKDAEDRASQSEDRLQVLIREAKGLQRELRDAEVSHKELLDEVTQTQEKADAKNKDAKKEVAQAAARIAKLEEGLKKSEESTKKWKAKWEAQAAETKKGNKEFQEYISQRTDGTGDDLVQANATIKSLTARLESEASDNCLLKTAIKSMFQEVDSQRPRTVKTAAINLTEGERRVPTKVSKRSRAATTATDPQ